MHLRTVQQHVASMRQLAIGVLEQPTCHPYLGTLRLVEQCLDPGRGNDLASRSQQYQILTPSLAGSEVQQRATRCTRFSGKQTYTGTKTLLRHHTLFGTCHEDFKTRITGTLEHAGQACLELRHITFARHQDTDQRRRRMTKIDRQAGGLLIFELRTIAQLRQVAIKHSHCFFVQPLGWLLTNDQIVFQMRQSAHPLRFDQTQQQVQLQCLEIGFAVTTEVQYGLATYQPMVGH
ncbi:hypothetical protein D3C77_461180 [compost metagenome]